MNEQDILQWLKKHFDAMIAEAGIAGISTGAMEMQVRIEKPTYKEDVLPEYRLYFNGHWITGFSLEACIKEGFRRANWDINNRPMQLLSAPPNAPVSAPAPVNLDDEIPF